MTKPGQIVFSTNPGSLHSKTVRFFTSSQWSHTFMITRSFGLIEAAQEADMLISVVPFDRDYRQQANAKYEIYEIISPEVTEAQILSSLDQCFEGFEGDTYGVLNLLWFVYRWINEKLLKRDVRKEKNWLSMGVICSELVYHYVYDLGEPFKILLQDFNPDTIQPEDIYQIVKAHPELFKLVESKG